MITLLLAALALAPQDPPDFTDAEFAMLKLRPARGIKLELFSAEPHFVNPVSFAFDERGRIYVVETHRAETCALDIRRFKTWTDEDLASRTVADRVAMVRKHMGAEADKLNASERVRLLEDRDGDGRADRAVTFADGFNTLADGVAAGVLVRDGNVWFADIPNLWLLRDENGDGRADVRRALHTGYGVRYAFVGHDLHGLRFGPDGKLYFSIGDRGLHVETEGRAVSVPDMGAVLRCNPDGSGLELFATGLRNPQELAFDQYGNLWTGDNNSDGGDKARWVYVVEGGDSGWRIGYQQIPDRGPWNREGLWKIGDEADAAYVVPPVAHLGRGPAGLAFNPGVGLADEYRHHFFLCDFPGGVRSLAVEPQGAGYRLVDSKEFLWDLWPTDADFGPDGALYVSDWVQSFKMQNKGRIFVARDPDRAKRPEVVETRRLLAEGMKARPVEALAKLLAHVDQRVRQAAQFELAARGESAALAKCAREGKDLLGRLHAIWGLGQTGEASALPALLKDPEAEVRAQAAKIAGERRVKEAAAGLVEALRDSNSRVRFFAAISLGKLGVKEAGPAILEMLRENADRDPFLRHAGVTGLAGIADVAALAEARRNPSKSARLGALLALRRLERAEIKAYLEDADPALVWEAARAIHDAPIPGAMEALADLLLKHCPPKALSRAVNANFRLGRIEPLVQFAGRGEAPEGARVDALRALSAWERPSGRDRVTGLWRPVAPRDPAPVCAALEPVLNKLFRGPAQPALWEEAILTSGVLRISSMVMPLEAIYVDLQLPPKLRARALSALAELQQEGAKEFILSGLEDAQEEVRREALQWLSRVKSPEVLERLERAASMEGSIPLRQAILGSLGEWKGEESAVVLERLVDRLLADQIPNALALDLVEAAGRKRRPSLRAKLEKYKARQSPDDPLNGYREALEGGDVAVGKTVFQDRDDAGCFKCHRVKDKGGEVGPDLTTIGQQRTREQILESILLPNRQIAEGFGQTLIATTQETVEIGRIESETPTEVVLVLSEGVRKRIPIADIRARKPGLSAMPEDLTKALSKRDLRDLVEYLSSLK